MLYWLTQVLASDVRAFNVFGYITFRAVLATMTALIIAIVLGPRVIARLTAMKIGQSVRTAGPQSHRSKQGTPTMGGALVLLSVTITTLLPLTPDAETPGMIPEGLRAVGSGRAAAQVRSTMTVK